jgi:serine/threonine protein kinase/tetratricopeptide (TPR) repeat protein
MASDLERARDIFLHAVGRLPADRWDAYVGEACGGDAGLAGRVRHLLRAHADAGSFLESPVVDPAGTVDRATAEGPGDVIGPYKLLEQIGEGGFGVVYLAEQTDPVRRKVALKVLKPGMDSRQVLARFEAERQALAIMDHPHIARVFDGGATPSGRPYFVMELVRGVPITQYCDDHKLEPRQRLELFVQVCQAVQHANQKGVIHRDIKPSNVLVSRHDTAAVVKVIDFGVAKALGQTLTDKTLFTGVAQMVGTPLYMSPEQAGMSDLDVDTRSDIYSLGVLLYELLTGTTPFTKERFKQAAYDEIRRIIREEEPPKPSTRLSDATASLPSVAAQRQTEPARLTKLVRGELDWIVMKALEKDRNRRYETANGFSMDVQRYLAGEVVQACPPSAVYRLRKFARKHRVMLTTAGAVAAALVAGFAVAAWQAVEATRAKGAAVANEQKALASAQAESKAKQEAQAREAEAKAVLKFVEDKVFAAGRPEGQVGGMGHGVSLRKAIDGALLHVSAGFKDQPRVEAHLRMTLGMSYGYLGEAKIAEQQYEQARRLYSQHLGPEHPDTLASMHNLASSYFALGRHAEALKLEEETLEIQRRVLPKDHPNTLVSMIGLASSYAALSRHAEAIDLLVETLEIQRRVLPKDHPDTLWSMMNLANSYYAMRRHAEALKLDEETLAIRKRVLGPEHTDTLKSMHNLAASYAELGRNAEALKLFVETLEVQRRVLPKDHPDTLMSMVGLAKDYVRANRHDEAVKLVEEFLPKADLPGVHGELYAQALAVRVKCYQKAGDLAGCRSTAELLEKRKLSDEDSLYNAACCRAITASLQAKAPAADALRLAKDEGDKAMAWLTNAVAAGYKNASAMKTDDALEYLRDREDFKKLVAELENKK